MACSRAGTSTSSSASSPSSRSRPFCRWRWARLRSGRPQGPPLTLLLTSFGVSLILQFAVRMIFGEGFRTVPTPSVLGNSFVVARRPVVGPPIVSVGTGIVLVLGL